MKQSFQNRDNNTIVTVVERGSDAKKLVFIMHGLSGRKEEPHLRVMAESFLNAGYTVVTWDAVHTFGESSGGNYEDATITNYFADLEDVVSWAKDQAWYVEPFVLAGHSFGGICTILYAQQHPDRVLALAPIATVVSGSLSFEIKVDSLEEWKRSGIRIAPPTDTGPEKRLKWNNMEDRLQYDVLRDAHLLTMPVLMVVGENDISTPPKHQKILYSIIPGKKELHVIKDAPHTFRTQEELAELQQLFDNWIEFIR